jgi:predicted nicotinamide N-methyase
MSSDDTPRSAFFPETPLDAVRERVEEQVLIDGRSFLITRPADSDRLLDHPTVRSAFAADEYMPYWADIWPGARMLAKAVLREPWAPGLEALEVGCGLGLAGIAALARGLRVTFSDYDPTALHFAGLNARANGFEDFRTLPLDWRCPPDEQRFPVILAADLVYEMRNVAPLLQLIKRLLRPGGICLLTDQDRPPVHLLRESLAAEGFSWTTQVMHAGEPGGRRTRGTLYRIALEP